MIDHQPVDVSKNLIRSWEYCAVVAILLLSGVIVFFSASDESITVDEVVHVPAGVSYLQEHDARMNPEHPPLMKVLAALPLVIGGLRLDYSLPHWQLTKDALFGEEAFSEIGPAGARWIALSRVPMIGVMLGLGFTIFWMARRIAGVAGGFLALLVFSSTPFFYAYGPLVHTDIGIALFALLAIWTFVSVWHQPDWPHAMRFGISLTAALLTKFTAGLLLPCFLLLAIWFAIRERANWAELRRSVIFAIAGIALSAVAVYFVYFALFWKNDTAAVLFYRYEHSVAPIPAMMQVAQFLKAHPACQHLIAPAIIYFLGVGHTLHALPRTSYLLGKIYAHGTAAYFPTLFVYKMPLAYLFLTALLVTLGLTVFFTKKRVDSMRSPDFQNQVRGLIVLFVVFACASVASPLNIGIRHISVPIATLTVLLALVMPLASRIPRAAVRNALLVAIVASVIGNFTALAAAYPNFIPYFNPLVGKHPKFDIAIDSNLDWGQGLIELQKFHMEHPTEKLAFDLKGSIPAVYLPSGVPFDCENGLPEGADWAAIGATRFVSQPELTHSAAIPSPQCRNFFQYPYLLKAGGAVYIFHVSETPAAIK